MIASKSGHGFVSYTVRCSVGWECMLHCICTAWLIHVVFYHPSYYQKETTCGSFDTRKTPDTSVSQPPCFSRTTKSTLVLYDHRKHDYSSCIQKTRVVVSFQCGEYHVAWGWSTMMVPLCAFVPALLLRFACRLLLPRDITITRTEMYDGTMSQLHHAYCNLIRTMI